MDKDLLYFVLRSMYVVISKETSMISKRSKVKIEVPNYNLRQILFADFINWKNKEHKEILDLLGSSEVLNINTQELNKYK